MAASKTQKKRIDTALARKNKYKNLVISDALGLEIFAMEQRTTSGGGATEAISFPGAQASDFVFATVVDDGTNNVELLQSVPATDQVSLTFSLDPSSDTVVNIMIIRSLASEDIY